MDLVIGEGKDFIIPDFDGRKYNLYHYRYLRRQYFKSKEFFVLKGVTHPEYSYFTFEGEEGEFRDQYWNIKEGDIVFDVGSSYGSYALTACVSGAQKVYAFEPEKTVFEDLETNILFNEWGGKCISYNFGLWSENGVKNMKDYAPHWPADSITSPEYKMHTLDFVAEILKINKLDWLKIDVEGAEENVIKGGLKTIEKFKPNLIIECHIFLDSELIKNIKNLIGHLYEFDEIPRPPCIMLCSKQKG